MLSDLRESGSIEQDADLVLMIYRDEYYNPDTPDRGITEVIVTKHRNGPVGTVKLLFEPQFTRFRNLAAPGWALKQPIAESPPNLRPHPHRSPCHRPAAGLLWPLGAPRVSVEPWACSAWRSAPCCWC